jgi:hypothetical protein
MCRETSMGMRRVISATGPYVVLAVLF